MGRGKKEEKKDNVIAVEPEKNKNKKEKKSVKKIIIIILLVLLFLIVTFLLYILFFNRKIKIEGFNSIDKVRFDTEYIDPEFSICYGAILNCKKLKITKDGTVDTKVVGEYILTYKYNVKNKEEKLEKKVIVYDDIKPEIIIDSELSFCKNGKVGNGSFHAIDNYDGDITDKVTLSIEGDKSYLEVSDSSNNKEVIEVNALEFSSDPTISLNGKEKMYIYVGSSYKEEGASASDICDGDITDKIVVSGSVNTNQKGTYTITYSVLNSDLKKAEVKRTVVVQARAVVASGSGCNKAGAIYLTFDDGPQSGSTEKILNVLRDEGVKATFFVTNSGPDSLIKREYDEGHTVALHTASHNYSVVYSSVDNYFNDLNKVADRVKRITGYDSKIIRFPGGSSNTVSRKYQSGIMTTLTSEVLSRGYRYHDWNVDSEDAGRCAGGSSSCVYSNVVNSLSLSRCNMVLMHDIKSYTANAIADIIHYGKEHGYTFEVITMDTPMVTQRVNN